MSKIMKTIHAKSEISKEKIDKIFPFLYKYVVTNLPITNREMSKPNFYDKLYLKFKNSLISKEGKFDALYEAISNDDLDLAKELFYSLMFKPQSLTNIDIPNSTPSKSASNYEYIIEDIFNICNVPYERYDRDISNDERFFPNEKNKNEFKKYIIDNAKEVFNDAETSYVYKNKMPRPDYLLYRQNIPFFLEVFGFSGNLYSMKKEFKKKHLPKFVNFAFIDLKTNNYSLIHFASILDNDVCFVSETGEQLCNQGVADISLTKKLQEEIPLLSKYNIDLCKHYVHQVRAAYVFKKRQSSKLHTIIASGMITIEQMVTELSSRYKSVHLLPDEEIVALYFVTVDNLKSHLKEDQIIEEELPLAASSWYGKMNK